MFLVDDHSTYKLNPLIEEDEKFPDAISYPSFHFNTEKL
jgi:hypothetical protein